MAVPKLKRFSGVKLLQVRHPIPVIRSAVAHGAWRPEARGPQRAFRDAHFETTGDELVDIMRFWVVWNEWAARYADVTYRLEDLDEGLFGRLLRLVGGAPIAAATAFASVPHDVNSAERRGRALGSLWWDDLPRGIDRDRLEQSMQRFGYQPGDPTT